MILTSGPAYVWLPGLYQLPVATQFRARELVLKALVSQVYRIELDGALIPLMGVSLGQLTGDDISPARINDVDCGPPIVNYYAVVNEGRGAGVRCEIGLYAATARNRKWISTVGPVPVTEWARKLGMPTLTHLSEGTMTFCRREDRRAIRHAAFEARKKQIWK